MGRKAYRVSWRQPGRRNAIHGVSSPGFFCPMLEHQVMESLHSGYFLLTIWTVIVQGSNLGALDIGRAGWFC